MPLELPPEVEAMIADAANGVQHYIPERSLDIVFGDGTIIHISTADIPGVDTEEFGAVDYVSDLDTAGVLSQSMDLSTDSCDITIENVYGVIGGIAIGTDNDAMNGARGILSTIFIKADGEAFQVEELHGQIKVPQSERLKGVFTCTLVSHLTSGGPIGGDRPATKHCSAIYKQAGGRCNSTDDSPDCDKTWDGSNGCVTKDAAEAIDPDEANNQSRFQGMLYKIQPLAGAAISDPGGTVDGGGDFNTYFRSRTGDYIGGVEIPLLL